MKLFVQDHNSILQDIKQDFEIVSNIEEADKVVLWNDVNYLERSIINFAHSLGKKVAVMQHGRKGTSKYYPPFNEKIRADKLFVWGEFDKESLIEAGQDPSKIQVVGTTIFSRLLPRVAHEGTNVVFCPEHWDRPVEENIRVRNELRKFKAERESLGEKINIITKLIESHDPDQFDNPVRSERDSEHHLAICAEVLSTADIVVGVSESTFELLAQSLDIPVVIMDEWEPKAFGGDHRYIKYRRIISEAATRSSLDNLGRTLKAELARDQREMADVRKLIAEREGGTHLDAHHEIRKAIIDL
jgi:hypothetical protein